MGRILPPENLWPIESFIANFSSRYLVMDPSTTRGVTTEPPAHLLERTRKCRQSDLSSLSVTCASVHGLEKVSHRGQHR